MPTERNPPRSDHKTVHPPQASPDAPGWICPLPDVGRLAISGKDAGCFLQGQTTCDILALPPGQSTLGAFCNAKGRVIALFRAFKSETAIHLLLPQELVAVVQKRLRVYVLRADVKIEDVSADWLTFGIGGNDLTPALAQRGAALPEHPQGVVEHTGGTIIRMPSASGDRVLLMMGPEKGQAMRAALEQDPHFAPAASSLWRLEDIRAGIPWITAAISEEFIPQMLNLDLLGGISFHKGCYTGQEIVARTHYLGNLKRRMYRLHCQVDKPPMAGDPIYAAGQDEQSVGLVIMAVTAKANDQHMLAVLNTSHAQSGDLRLHEPAGTRLSLLSLPYQ